MQKRLVRKLDLEMMLSQVKPHPAPSPSLEQYTIPTDVAATILYSAAYARCDIVDRTVLDLGCGTGRLALAAAFLGAKEVVGVDIDRAAIKTAVENSVRAGFKDKTHWIVADIEAIIGQFDTVLQNPPFGVQERRADRRFLAKAIESGRTVYSLHKSVGSTKFTSQLNNVRSDRLTPASPSPFLTEFIERNGGRISAVYALKMTVPHMFAFHTKKKHEFMVDVYIIERT